MKFKELVAKLAFLLFAGALTLSPIMLTFGLSVVIVWMWLNGEVE